jgi:hypothetical protein
LPAAKCVTQHLRGCVDEEDWRASSDYVNASRLALEINDGDQQGAELLMAWLERRTDVLVSAQWPQVSKLAFALLEHDSLTGAQVKAILDGSNGSAPNAAAKMSGGGKSGDSQAP